jgi:hypothetical protein
MLQAFRLELQYAAMKRKQQHEKEEAEGRKNSVGERSYTSVPSGMEAGQTDCQHGGTEEVSDQVHSRHKAKLYFELLSI